MQVIDVNAIDGGIFSYSRYDINCTVDTLTERTGHDDVVERPRTTLVLARHNTRNVAFTHHPHASAGWVLSPGV